MGRKIPIGVVLGAALLLAAGVGGAIWVTGQGGRSVGETARLVPADVALYVTVNTDPASRQWIQMRGLLERLGAADQAEGARDQGLGAANVDWDDDLAPFLGGEATVAARPFEDGE